MLLPETFSIFLLSPTDYDGPSLNLKPPAGNPLFVLGITAKYVPALFSKDNFGP